VDGYPPDDAKDLKLVRSLAADFPEIDLRKSVKAWATYKLDHPLEGRSSPRAQVRQWVAHEREFAAERQRERMTAPSQMRIERATPEDAAWIERERAEGRAAW
jgi:hypothetical protein